MDKTVVTKRAWVFAGGDFSPDQLGHCHRSANDAVVCVDSGLFHCWSLGWQPTRVVGDLDSVSPSALESLGDVPIDKFPTRKNCSDLELALDLLDREGFTDVIVVGISGGRTDHLLFNWLLPVGLEPSMSLRFIDASVDATLVSPQQPYSDELEIGATLSLFPLTVVTGVIASGLEYPLKDAVLEPGVSLSLSNRVSECRTAVSVASGLLWVMRVNTH